MEFTLTREAKDSWSGIISYDGAGIQLRPEIDERDEVVTGMTDEEARELEKALRYKDGYLAPSSNFWVKKFFIPFHGKLVLNDEKPLDRLWLYVLRSMKKVAVGREQLKTKSKALFLLTSKELEIKTNSAKYDNKEQAWKLFLNATDAKLKQTAVVLEKAKPRGNVTDVSSMDMESVRNKLRGEIERDPNFFITIIGDEDLGTKFEVLELVTAKVLGMNTGGFFYKSDFIAATLDDMVIFMKDPHNQPKVIGFKQELKGKKVK